MRKPIAVLFENKVFSLAPNSFSNHSYLEDAVIQKNKEEYFMENPSELSSEKLIYQYDPIETFFRDQRIQNRKASKLDIDFAKSAIVNDRFPAWLDFSIGEEELSDDSGGTFFSPASFYLNGGRSSLILFLRDNRYSDAIPQLREVAMHDLSKSLRRLAIHGLWPLDRQKADSAINDILFHTNDRFAIMEIVKSIALHSTGEIFVPTLRKKFEEHYFDYVDNWLSIKWYGTVPQSIVLACGHIATLGSLEILEECIRHPYPHVEKNAKYGLIKWVETVVSSGSSDPVLFNRALKVLKKYNLRDYSGVSWNFLKKGRCLLEI